MHTRAASSLSPVHSDGRSASHPSSNLLLLLGIAAVILYLLLSAQPVANGSMDEKLPLSQARMRAADHQKAGLPDERISHRVLLAVALAHLRK